jgi:RNA polymerase sigma-70 factor (ECF subfamily)
MSRSIHLQANDAPWSRRTVVVQQPFTPLAPANEPEVDAGSGAARATVDRAQIEALVVREYPGLRLHLTRRTGDPQVAADLLNEAICTTWEKWAAGRLAEPRQIVGYIFQVALNLLRNHRRLVSERPEKRVDVTECEALTSAQATDDAVEAHIAARVKELIRGMGSVRDRTILVRFYLDEQDRESICRELNITPAQFAKVLHRARTRLRTLLESDGLKRSDLFSLLGIL